MPNGRLDNDIKKGEIKKEKVFYILLKKSKSKL